MCVSHIFFAIIYFGSGFLFFVLTYILILAKFNLYLPCCFFIAFVALLSPNSFIDFGKQALSSSLQHLPSVKLMA